MSPLPPLALVFGLALPALAEPPLSASDWLSGSLRGPERESSAWRPGDAPPPGLPGAAGPRPVASTGEVGAVQVTRLGSGNPDAAGLIAPAKAGLPPGLWEGSDGAALADLILRVPSRLPAMNGLLHRLLVAQLTPPPGALQGRLLLARADRLLDGGALERAQSLLIAAGPRNPEIFRRLFDIALLQGQEARACEIMNNTPGVAPSFAARIFCLAQTGDWAAAAISLRGAETLGLLEPGQALLLTHFLDDAYVDSDQVLPVADPMTPLDFRIHEAIGQPLPTAALPIAFAHSDLRPNNGWKGRLDAAERLARAGAIPATTLRALYSEQKPAASGGVWDRAAAMQTLEAALASGDAAPALPPTFEQFRAAGLAEVLAAMIAADLPATGEGPAGQIAAWLRQWQGLATPVPLVWDPALRADPVQPPATRQGEALLAAMADIDAGMDADLPRAGRGLAMLRALGLSADADLAAAQLSLLPVMRPAP